MSRSTNPLHTNPLHTGVRALSVAGVVSVLLGALAIAFPFASSIGVELAFGAILLVAGLAEIARGVSGRTRAPSFWTFLFAVMAVACAWRTV